MACLFPSAILLTLVACATPNTGNTLVLQGENAIESLTPKLQTTRRRILGALGESERRK